MEIKKIARAYNKEIAKRIKDYANQLAKSDIVDTADLEKNFRDVVALAALYESKVKAKQSIEDKRIYVVRVESSYFNENINGYMSFKPHTYEGNLEQIKHVLIFDDWKEKYNKVLGRDFDKDYANIKNIKQAITMAKRINKIKNNDARNAVKYKYIILDGDNQD